MGEHRSSRRGFLAGGAAALGAAVAGVAAGTQIGASRDTAGTPTPMPPPADLGRVEFHGVHQAGIADPAPTHALYLAFDLSPSATVRDTASMMRAWTALASALAVGDTSIDPTLISVGSDPASFTMTVGIGGAAVERLGRPRPAALVDLTPFPGDQLVEGSSHGDVIVQLCSNDAVYLGGAARAVRAAAAPTLRPRWQMSGFRGVAASTSSSNGRNLMGQIDGTNNLAVSRSSATGSVWVERGEPQWMAGGSYIAIRRFRMHLDDWESQPMTIRDHAIGRHLSTGAPLGSQNEFDQVDLETVDAAGAPVIPLDSHIRLAAPTRGAGEEMLRRSYSYSSGQSSPDGHEDAGLLFISYQKDPRTSFIPVQQRLAVSDAMSRFITATSSALFAMFPGVIDDSDWYGRALLG